MTAERAFERAVEWLPEIITAARSFGADKAITLFARELLLAQAEVVNEVAKVAADIADGTAQSSAYLQGVADGAIRVAVRAESQAAELRRAAEGINHA